jgi:hypothetical protein
MKVKDKIDISNDHSIEWGDSSWGNGADVSIRNRYDNKVNGGFNVRGSSELPWYDFNNMIIESINRNHFSKSEIFEITIAISKYMNK